MAEVDSHHRAAGDLSLFQRRELRLLTCGSVDDGKSTLIGRLINDVTGMFEDQIEELREASQRFGSTDEEIDFALLLDGLEAEREQGITIDVAYRYFSSARRAFIVADTPGHPQYTRNMATGASNAELAILLVDARKGILDQTRRHAALVSLLGIRHVVLAVNKMDLVEFSEARFREVTASFVGVSASLSFRSIVAIPIAARFGDNVVQRSGRLTWYSGPPLLEYLEEVDTSSEQWETSLRFPVQWINRPNSDFRGVAGTIASGRIAVGDAIIVAISGQSSKVARIVTFDGDLQIAECGRAVTLTLVDQIDVIRGDMLVDPKNRPTVTRRFVADLIWMDEAPAASGAGVLLKIGAMTTPAILTRVVDTLAIDTLERSLSDSLGLNGIGRVEISTADPICFNSYQEIRRTGAFILIDRSTLRTVGAGLVIGSLNRATNVHYQAQAVTPEVRETMKGQKGIVVWMTGLPGAGKSTIANLAESALASMGKQTMLLDGDNLRQGLNADLGFDQAARTENVRRVGEVAKLMVDAGLITIVALVSPFRSDRQQAASLIAEGRFLEIFVDTPIDVCRSRDPKGLYARADRGKVANVTGRDQPYEAPDRPALVLRTTELSAEEAANELVKLILERS